MPSLQERLFGVRLTPQGEIESGSIRAHDDVPMYQELNDPVDVLALFQDGSIKPERFRWKGHVHRVAQVTGSWKTDKGEFLRPDGRRGQFLPARL